MGAGNILRLLNDAFDGGAQVLTLKDNDILKFGTDGDVLIKWNGTSLDICPAAANSQLTFGDGTTNPDILFYGQTTSTYVEFDTSLDQFYLRGPIRPRGFNNLPRRYELQWVAGSRGKPGINADIQNAAEATRMIADPDFEVLGTNAVSSCTSYYAEGGITLTTTTASGDQVILVPHLDASQSAWGSVTWGTDQQTVWECVLVPGATISSSIYWAGLKLTNTSVVATDNDQAFFRYEAGVNSGKWQVVYSIGGTDTTTNSTVTVTAGQEVHLKITIDASRIAKFYIDGALVKTSTALTDAKDLIPYIGVQTATTAARVLNVISQAISRDIGA